MTVNGDKVSRYTALRINEFSVAGDLLQCCKYEALELCRSTLEATTPSLRQLLNVFLQDELQLQEKIGEYTMEHGFYRPYLDPVEQIKHDLHLASAQPTADQTPLA